MRDTERGGERTREDVRQLVHIFYGFFALLLRVLSPAAVAGIAVAAVVHNRFLLPLYGRALLRPTDWSVSGGLLLYPVAVLGFVLVFRRQPQLAAAAWGVLAFGDGFATLVGRAVPGPRLPWNPRKTVAGTAAYFVFGTIGAALLMAFVSGRGGPGASLTPQQALVPAALAAFACAAVESLPLALDDNATAGLAAAAVLGVWAVADPALLVARQGEITARVVPAATGTGALALAAWAARTVDVSGAVGGVLLASAVWVFGGWECFALFFAFFFLGSAATRYGKELKERRGVAQGRGGRRGLRHAVANTGVPAAFAFLAAAVPDPAPYLLAVAGAFATAAFDTVSSEVGQVLGRRTVLITTFRPVAVGTEGAVSREGTLAGLLAAAVVAGLGAVLGLYAPVLAGVVVGAAFLGGAAESVAGAVLSRRGWVGSGILNLFNTAIGAGICLATGLAMGR